MSQGADPARKTTRKVNLAVPPPPKACIAQKIRHRTLVDDKKEALANYERSLKKQRREQDNQSSVDSDEEEPIKKHPTWELKVGHVVAGTWKVTELIASGNDRSIFKGQHIRDGTTIVIKTEPINQVGLIDCPFENQIYKAMQGAAGFPELIYFNNEAPVTPNADEFDLVAPVLIIEYLGASLAKLFKSQKVPKSPFSLKTVLMLGIQTIQRLEDLHNRGIIHRDIKPGNFVMGLGPKAGTNFYIKNNGQHFKFKEEARTHGTCRYASINTHLEHKQSRRDDMEALVYSLLQFIKGRLPWQDAEVDRPDDEEEFWEDVRKAKQATSIEKLTAGLPACFREILTHVRALKFSEKPDYSKYKESLMACMKKNSFAMDNQFDWMAPTKMDISNESLSEEEEDKENATKPTKATLKKTSSGLSQQAVNRKVDLREQEAKPTEKQAPVTQSRKADLKSSRK